MFGCARSYNAHIERKKSKCDYRLEKEPTAEEIALIEKRVNEVIASNLDVTESFLTQEEAASIVDLSKLPDDASEMLRVRNTREIGTFKIISADYDDGRWRLRWKIIQE